MTYEKPNVKTHVPAQRLVQGSGHSAKSNGQCRDGGAPAKSSVAAYEVDE